MEKFFQDNKQCFQTIGCILISLLIWHLLEKWVITPIEQKIANRDQDSTEEVE